MTSPIATPQGSAPSSSPVTPAAYKRKFWLVFLASTTLYAVSAYLTSRRYVWFDELWTLDIAQFSSLHQLWSNELRFDNQTPIGYLLSHFSMSVFGRTPFGLRVPSMVEFYFGSVAIFFFVRRKVGDLFSLLAVLLIWSSALFLYATEARPYALVYMFFALLLLSWDTAIYHTQRKAAIAGVAISAVGLLSGHVLAPLSLFPFVAAEVVRFIRRRRPDYPLWAALLLPLAVTLIYIPLVAAYGTLMIFKFFQGSPHRMIRFYYLAVEPIAATMLVALVALLSRPATRPERRRAPELAAEHLTVFLCLVLNPIILNLIMMVRHGGFFDRYCITTTIALYAGLMILLGLRLQPGYLAAGIAMSCLVALLAFNVRETLRAPRGLPGPHLTEFRPDLPIVAANGQTFYDMNHHETPQLLHKLFYLKDREASIRFESSNYFHDFEEFDDMRRAHFPITANVGFYSSFTQEHKQFLVFGNPSEWLMAKLREDGATATLLEDYSGASPYPDDHLFLITLPSGKAAPPLPGGP